MKNIMILCMVLTAAECASDPFGAIDLAIDEISIVRSAKQQKADPAQKHSFKPNDQPEVVERRIQKVSENGKNYYQVHHKLTLKNRQTIQKKSLIEIGTSLKEFSFDFVRKSPDGKLLEKKSIRFDNPSWQYPEDLYSVHVLPMVLRAMISNNIHETNFYLRLSAKSIIRMNLKVSGKEKIQVPSGKYDCIKITMQPDIQSVVNMPKSVSFLIKPFVSDHEFWFSKKAPYPLVKYQGRPGMPGTPEEVMELVMYENLHVKKKMSGTLAQNTIKN